VFLLFAIFCSDRYRIGEVATAYELLSAMHRRQATKGLVLSGGTDPASFFAGRLDLARAAVIGHSYGGATITSVTAQDNKFRAGVALDPWWWVPARDAACELGDLDVFFSLI
jgi:platelet-activating factor acetylhydrolase